MEKMPMFGASQDGRESIDKAEKLFRAREISQELKLYDGQDVDSVTNKKIKELEAELYNIMVLPNITWTECVKNKLPWDPRFENMKQIANDNRAPAVAAAA